MKFKQPCIIAGCPNLVNGRGYCKEHIQFKKEFSKEKYKSYRKLDEKKDQRTIDFYNSPPWRRVSKEYKNRFPLCQQCEKIGKTSPVQIVHHTIKLQDLLLTQRNPLSFKYLQSVCFSCHQRELSRYRNKIES